MQRGINRSPYELIFRAHVRNGLADSWLSLEGIMNFSGEVEIEELRRKYEKTGSVENSDKDEVETFSEDRSVEKVKILCESKSALCNICKIK